MRIAIDGKWYLSGPPGGHRYVRSIVDALIKIDDSNEYFIYLKGTEGETLRNGRNFSFIPLFPDFSPFRVLFKLPQEVSTKGVDILFTQTLSPLWGSFKKVVTIHDILTEVRPDLFDVREIIYHKFLHLTAKRADIIFTVSEYSKNQIAEILKIAPEKIVITRNGVDERFFEYSDPQIARKALDLPSDFILYLGRINERKNLTRMLEAFHIAAPSDIHLVIAGKEDWKTPDLRPLIHRLDLDDRVHFTGFIDYEILPSLLRAASGFIYVPILEGFGIPPLEAMAAGLPAVVSETGSLKEVVGDAAIKVNPEDTGDIARGINILCNDSTIREELSQKGRERARSFRWEDSARIIIQTLSDLLSGR